MQRFDDDHIGFRYLTALLRVGVVLKRVSAVLRCCSEAVFAEFAKRNAQLRVEA